MTLFNEEETRLELTFSEQMITEYTEIIFKELLNLFWGKSSTELKQTIKEILPIDKDIEFYKGVTFGLLLSVITILESINKSIHSPSIIKGMLIIKKMIKVITD